MTDKEDPECIGRIAEKYFDCPVDKGTHCSEECPVTSVCTIIAMSHYLMRRPNDERK